MSATSGRTAVVTGAADGVGRAVVRRLIDEGWIAIAVDRDEAGLASLREEVEAAPGAGEIRVVASDLADPKGALDAISGATSDLDRLDGLANVAGMSRPLGTERLDPEVFEEVVRVNLTAPYALAVGLWPRLVGGGRIVNVGSMSSFAPIPNGLAYMSSKAGLNGLTIALNAEGRADRITARCICLGWVETGLAADSPAPRDALMTTDEAASEVARVLAGGGTPRNAIVYPFGRGGLQAERPG